MKNFEIIDRYLYRKMSQEEQESFQQQITTDKELAREVKLQELEESALEELAIAHLKGRIQGLQPEKTTSPNKKKPPRNFWLGILITVLLVIVLISVLRPNLNQGTSVKQQDAIENHEKSEPAIENAKNATPTKEEKSPINSTQQKSSPIAMVEAAYTDSYNSSDISLKGENNEKNNNPLKFAYAALAKNKLSEAIQLAQSVIKDSTYGTDALELIGHANFQLQHFSAAATAFQQLVDKQSAMFGEQWQWFLLLSYAAQLPEKKVGYENIARKIEADTENTYYTKTLSLDKQLKQSGY